MAGWERLSFEDGVLLATTPDPLGVGRLADHVRESLHGNAAYFNVNRHLDPTNVCVASCGLCAFADKFFGVTRRWTSTVERDAVHHELSAPLEILRGSWKNA